MRAGRRLCRSGGLRLRRKAQASANTSSSPSSLASRSCSLACSPSRVFSDGVVAFAASRLYRAASRSWNSRTSDLRIDQHPPKAIRLRRNEDGRSENSSTFALRPSFRCHRRRWALAEVSMRARPAPTHLSRSWWVTRRLVVQRRVNQKVSREAALRSKYLGRRSPPRVGRTDPRDAAVCSKTSSRTRSIGQQCVR